MREVKILVVGAGFSGLCSGIKFKQAGIDDFVILEKASDLGGTWRANTYPGAECDIPSALYSYSFEHNAQWEFKWSGQAQILQYQRDTSSKYGLHTHINYDQEVVNARFDASAQRWVIESRDGTQYLAQHFVCAVGQLDKPFTPQLPNAESFDGAAFHSAQWDHSVDFSNKRVAVIGNAASAVQLIPEVAKIAQQVTVYQRTPNWVLAKFDRPYARWEQQASAKFGCLTKAYRWCLWGLGEYVVLPAINGKAWAQWFVTKLCLRNLHKNVKSAELRAKLTPNYPVGAKRVLFSDHYYPALERDNVILNIDGVRELSHKGVVDNAGHTEFADIVVYATGFITNPFLADIHVAGLDGQTIRQAWRDGAQAYLGMSTAGFPNLHLLYGPNTNLGHTSVIIMFEAQADYIIRAISYLDHQGLQSLEVKHEVEELYNIKLQQRLAATAFSSIEQSWYKVGAKITTNWPGGTREYRKRLKEIDWQAYTLK